MTTTNPGITKVQWADYTIPKPAEGVFHFANISDIHLGHDRVPTKKMIADLDMFFTEERMQVLSAVIISGDLFDQRLAHDSDEAFATARWMERFVRLAKRTNTAIALLAGTPSHDNGQPEWMVIYNELAAIGADVRYYPELSIDTIVPGGPTALFVPDEVNHDATRTWTQVNDLLRDRGMEKTDFGIMHGFFHFQAPVKTISSHDEERYRSIIRYKVMIGHHHTHATYEDFIVVPGSPDRHKHKQEEDKGHYQFSFSRERGVFDEQFIVNPNAVVFTTLDMQGKTLSEIYAILTEKEGCPDGSNFRLRLSRQDEGYVSLSNIKTKFPHFRITIDTIEAKRDVGDYSTFENRPVVTSIRPDTILGLVLERAKNASPEVLAIINRELAQ